MRGMGAQHTLFSGSESVNGESSWHMCLFFLFSSFLIGHENSLLVKALWTDLVWSTQTWQLLGLQNRIYLFFKIKWIPGSEGQWVETNRYTHVIKHPNPVGKYFHHPDPGALPLPGNTLRVTPRGNAALSFFHGRLVLPNLELHINGVIQFFVW